MNNILLIILIAISLSGIFLAYYIWHKKKSNQVLVCPLNSDCNAVVQSKYSRFLGIPLEFLGILYYLTIFAVYSLSLIFVFPAVIFSFAVILTTIGFIFSIYLISIQLFVIKQWCAWCLVSACFSTAIFIIAMIR